MTLPQKSEHKKAWQTSQRALERVREVQRTLSSFAHPARPTLLQRLSWIATMMVGVIAIAGVIYRFWPAIEIVPLSDDLTADPMDARFQFRNVGRIDVEGAVISCRITHGDGRSINTTGVMLVEPTGRRGQHLGRLGAGAPAIVRTCGGPGIQKAASHPATISIDVVWLSLRIGHQYFVSQLSLQRQCCMMVPERDALSR